MTRKPFSKEARRVRELSTYEILNLTRPNPSGYLTGLIKPRAQAYRSKKKGQLKD